jgi:hypothetical protein
MIDLSPTDGRIEPEEIHDVLRNDRRRRVLQYLKRKLEPVSLRDLSEWLASRESAEPSASKKLRQSVYNSLHQTHLPKMDETGIVEYDRDRKTVALGERARDVDIYMDVVTRYGFTWGQYYRTLGVIGLFVAVASETGFPIVADVPTLLVTVVLLALFGLSTTYQMWLRRWFYVRVVLGEED